jgi:germination protein M
MIKMLKNRLARLNLRKNLKYYLAGLLIVACAVTAVLVFTLGGEETAPVSGISAVSNETLKPQRVPVYLYFGNEDLTGLATEVRYIPIEEAAKSTASLATAIVNQLLLGPSDSDLKAVIPEDSALLDTVEIDGDKAIVNLNDAFVENHPGGKTLEALTIYSIVNSLTELKDIQSVVFKINGELREEYAGHFKFDNPFPRSVSLVLDGGA